MEMPSGQPAASHLVCGADRACADILLLKQIIGSFEERLSYIENTLFRSSNGKSVTTRLALTEQSIDRLDEIVRRLEDLEESYRSRQWQLIVAILMSVLGFVFSVLTRVIFHG
jgi:C4-dicarboxylate-specific signal transduction histidine kinase